MVYTPGVAFPSMEIFRDKEKIYDYTMKGNSVAVVSDGSAVLGLGNIGPEAALPVMEGKAALFKELADIDAFPICLKEQNTEKTIETIKNISVVFGGINLEDFKAPECFEIEKSLQDLGIPVMHDDQHGTAIVVLAAMINSLKVVNKGKDIKIVINGTGAAGIGIAKMFLDYGLKNIVMCDTKGIVYEGRSDLNESKEEISKLTNREKKKGSLVDAIRNSDVFVGVSKGNLLKSENVSNMSKDSIVFAMANPIPEIMPDDARKAGAKIVASGRSDFRWRQRDEFSKKQRNTTRNEAEIYFGSKSAVGEKSIKNNTRQRIGLVESEANGLHKKPTQTYQEVIDSKSRTRKLSNQGFGENYR